MNLFFYPLKARANINTQNPYTLNFIQALRNEFTILNDKDYTSTGILNTSKYLLQIDILLLNWIEDLPDKRGGIMQTIYFVILLIFLKIRKKKIVWVMHNKASHNIHNLFLKKYLFRFLLTFSDMVITHASEGVDFAFSITGKRSPNIKYFPHPIIPDVVIFQDNKEYDILIWGSIAPYKGIAEFLLNLHQAGLANNYRIHLAGKTTNESVKESILPWLNEKITLDDRFIERDELKSLVQKTKVILFTYSSDSILCSGALIDSLSFGATILGPETGNFKDLSKRGLIRVYKDFDELVKLLDVMLVSYTHISEPILNDYFKETSWSKYVDTLSCWLNNIAEKGK
jgi:beta-1,4-mannosyltransferase